jgi:hypothetical protein
LDTELVLFGAWPEVKTKEAFLSYLAGDLRFGLELRDNSMLFRGGRKIGEDLHGQG